MLKLRTIEDADIKGKRILLRVDYNVPLDSDQNIVDDLRILESLPTIRHILYKGCSKLIIVTHLGRPNGKFDKKLTTLPLAIHLERLLDKRVVKLDRCLDPNYNNFIESSNEVIFMLENLRFYSGEEGNDLSFAKKLSVLADIFINDAFGCIHRAHASIDAITTFMPSYAGFLVQKEVESLQLVTNIDKNSKLAVILGGSKISDKILLVNNLLTKANIILIGGGMAYTFLLAKGINVGKSKVERDQFGNTNKYVSIATEILDRAKRLGVEILLPTDHIVSTSIDDIENVDTTNKIEEEFMGLDIGLNTVLKYQEVLSKTDIVFWNGPMGVYEIDSFSQGTRELAKRLAKMCKDNKLKAIIGGGDTAAAINKYGLQSFFTHISTGGGASLEFMEGKNLPGVISLTKDVNFF